jgi:type I restriction enzyme S subunit
MKQDFKQTEIGILPLDWQVLPITDLLQRGSRITYGVVKPGPSPADGVLFIRGGDVFDGKILTEQLRTISQEVSDQYKRTRLTGGEILVSLVGYPGEVALVPLGLAGANIARQVALIRLDSKQPVSGDFVCRFLQSNTGRGLLLRESIGSAQQVINLRDISRVVIVIPPLPEQRAIAAALSDVDELLGGLDRLIAKKRDLKQAALQQLLTGQTRLPGFKGEWEVRRLGEHLIILKNGTNSRAELTLEGATKYLHYGDIHTCGNSWIEPSALPSLPKSKAASLDRLCEGDLVFADASEDLTGVGKSVEIQGVGGTELVSGLHTIAVRFDKEVAADGFKGYLQFMPDFSNHLKRLAAGTKVFATNRSHILSATIKLPPTSEQMAIATVLRDMSNEISALEKRREKTRALKQAMMQELLTGRIRLF